MKISTKITSALLLGALLVPALSSVQNVEAKPKNGAPAWGYRDKDDRRESRTERREYRKEKREDRREYRRDRRDDRRDYRSDRREDDTRRYRMMYRTRYNQAGQPYRVWTRVYY